MNIEISMSNISFMEIRYSTNYLMKDSKSITFPERNFIVGPRLEWSEPGWHFRYESTFRQRLYFLLNSLNINHSPWLLEEQCFKTKNENTWIYSALGQYYCSWLLTSIRFGFWLGQFFEVEENLFVHFGFEQSGTDYRG